jgi:hypothetical protein
MYSTKPGLILGFHGCDKSVANKVLNGNTDLNFSENTFDWLGHGIYFWEYSAERALEYVVGLKNRKGKPAIKNPAIIGAVIDLGHCLDLIEYKNLQLLKISYQLFKDTQISSGFALPKNRSGGSLIDFLLRDLDCAII